MRQKAALRKEHDPLLGSIESRFASIKEVELQRFRRARNGLEKGDAAPVEKMVDDILMRILSELKEGLQTISRQRSLQKHQETIESMFGLPGEEDS